MHLLSKTLVVGGANRSSLLDVESDEDFDEELRRDVLVGAEVGRHFASFDAVRMP